MSDITVEELSGYPEGTVLESGETIVGDYQDVADENNLDAEGNPTVTRVVTGWHKEPKSDG